MKKILIFVLAVLLVVASPAMASHGKAHAKKHSKGKSKGHSKGKHSKKHKKNRHHHAEAAKHSENDHKNESTQNPQPSLPTVDGQPSASDQAGSTSQ